MPPLFADADAPSRPLHVVPVEGLEAWLAAQPEAVRGWLAASGFTGALGDLALIPGDGGVAGAVFGYGT